MYRIILFAATLFISSYYAMAQEKAASLFDRLLFTSQNDTLPYRLLKPVSPGSKESYPLVIFLHGAGERGNDNEVQLIHIKDIFLNEVNRGKYPCYVLAPQCPKKEKWANYDFVGDQVKLAETPSNPMKMLISLIDKLSKEYSIDQSKIYITGLSMGGFGTWDLIARYPNKFAAAIPICGGGDPRTAPAIKHIPLWAFHGSKDSVVPPLGSRRMIQALQQAGGFPGYTEYPDVEHNSWVYAYKEPHLIHWMFSKTLRPGNFVQVEEDK
jgi:predicted peptidase